MQLCLLLVIAFVCGQNGLGWTLRIEISPDEVNLIMPSTVKISCAPGPSTDQQVKEIVILEVVRQDGRPIAILKAHSDPTFQTQNHKNYQAVGRINNIVLSKSFLSLTLLKPKLEDTGLYQCKMYYFDFTGILKEMRSSANLTVTGSVADQVEYLVEKVNKMDKEMKERIESEAVLRKNISILERKLDSQISKENYMSAFSATYSKRSSENVEDTIIFDEIIMRVGEGYDETSGLFTAPKSGIYGFSVVAMTLSTDGYIELGLFVNSQLKGSLSMSSTSTYYDQSSISLFVVLKATDEVNVGISAISDGMKIQDSKATFFTGYLYKEL